ncbi:voltage-dependent calcium channel gamma-1 subunit [Parasteatoda tepidariorum]|uniref:voltage-dependent calcium channel gamma-1 subunit n=1 Tax=Parasteatoda tepidariorum TaxID=114398 RepID=UPI00077F9465|nr:uncharacterized protein LOC107440992 [Parasteatoda tepidariorum]XP_015909710.1 uncharacterized protein LOC107440992 [Parasteatoda tepidariorum]
MSEVPMTQLQAAPAEEPRTRKKSAIQRIRHRVSKKRDPAAVLAFEQRLLMAATIAVLVAAIVWIISITTDYWFHVLPEKGSPIYINKTNTYFVRSYSGLWKICKFTHPNGTLSGEPVKNCHNHRLFPSDEFIQKNPEVDRTILDYTRTETAFSIISLCLMLMGFGFSIYTFRHPRYMFKRLAGGVHLISAAATLIVVEVVINSVAYEERFLSDRHPKGAVWSYGYSFVLAWITFVILVISGLTFLICSRKRKGIPGTGDDTPNILGRM